MSEWETCGASSRRKSGVTATLEALGVGEVATFKAKITDGYNVPASAATRITKATGRLFRWRRLDAVTVEFQRIA